MAEPTNLVVLPSWRKLTFKEMAQQLKHKPESLRVVLGEAARESQCFSLQAGAYFWLGMAKAHSFYHHPMNDDTMFMEYVRHRAAEALELDGKPFDDANLKLGDFLGKNRVFGRG